MAEGVSDRLRLPGVPLPLWILSERSRRELEDFRPDQEAQATAGVPQLSQIHAAGKAASGSGRRTIREISHAGNKCRIEKGHAQYG